MCFARLRGVLRQRQRRHWAALTTSKSLFCVCMQLMCVVTVVASVVQASDAPQIPTHAYLGRHGRSGRMLQSSGSAACRRASCPGCVRSFLRQANTTDLVSPYRTKHTGHTHMYTLVRHVCSRAERSAAAPRVGQCHHEQTSVHSPLPVASPGLKSNTFLTAARICLSFTPSL